MESSMAVMGVMRALGGSLVRHIGGRSSVCVFTCRWGLHYSALPDPTAYYRTSVRSLSSVD